MGKLTFYLINLHLEAIVEIQPVEKENRIFDPKQAQEAVQKTAFEKEMESKVVVPKALIDPHPLVAKTEKSLRTAKPDERGILRAFGPGTLSTVVSPDSIDRAMRILDTLIKALEERGMTVKVEDTEGVINDILRFLQGGFLFYISKQI